MISRMDVSLPDGWIGKDGDLREACRVLREKFGVKKKSYAYRKKCRLCAGFVAFGSPFRICTKCVFKRLPADLSFKTRREVIRRGEERRLAKCSDFERSEAKRFGGWFEYY